MVRLEPMNEAEFQNYLKVSIPEYAQEHVKAGRWSAEEALQRAKEEYDEVMPDGLQTKDQHVFSIVDERTATKVGMLWFAVHIRGQKSSAYVFDVIIAENYRRRGYGEQAFRALEEKVHELGIGTISLHVFGHDHAARAMYEKLGYVPTNITMSKTLADAKEIED